MGDFPLTPKESNSSLAEVNDMFDLAAPPLQKPVVARLVALREGLESVDVHQDDALIVLGRGKDLVPPFRITTSGKISSAHCQIRTDPITFRVTVTDVSTNGTFVNGSRLPKNAAHPLQKGDRLSLTKPAEKDATTDGETADTEAVEFLFQRVKEETSVNKMEEELTCGICGGIYHRPCSVLPCMHVFCAGCISKWVKSAATCPECRATIDSIRPTHKIQSCVDQLLLSDPSKKRPEEEIRMLEQEDCIAPTGKVMRPNKRPRESDSDSDGSGSWNSDEGSDGPLGGGPLRIPHFDRQHFGQPAAPQRCPECDTPSSIDQFQCVPGGPHLRCSNCGTLFPERPLCGRPQRCHLCSSPFCSMYYQGARGCAGSLKPLKDYDRTTLPAKTFGGNATEQSILTTYLASKNILVAQAWQECIRKLGEGTWAPDMVSISGPLAADSPVCARCSENAFAALLFHYRRAIPSQELPESVTKRSNCWYGAQCRTQFHKVQHAQNFNHVCYQEKRKE